MTQINWVKNQASQVCQDFLRQCNQRSLQDQWWICEDESSSLDTRATPLSLNDRGHIAWSKGRSLLWLGQDLVMPESLNGYPLKGLSAKLALTWWAEVAQIFVNGTLVQEGDLFDCSARILLTDTLGGGERFQVRVRLVSPGHDAGALVSSQLQFEQLQHLDRLPEPSFIADELAVVQHYLDIFDPSENDRLQKDCQPLQELATQPWRGADSEQSFHRTVLTLRDRLCDQWGDGIKQRQIHLLGHAHLDLAWLWPVTETWDVAERTFRSVLALQQDFPELIFAHSSPVIYQWLEQHRPALFEQIRQSMHRGQWEVMAGMWVEPDVILPSGESLVRQVLYGQRYVEGHLAQRNRVAWLPDSFGFSGQLPQILKQSGIDWFITQKLTWNDTTVFPHSVFHWQGLDGTIVSALMSAPIGKGIAPVEMVNQACQWEKATGSQDFLWLPGVGDHGGGPTRDMLETARRWQRSPCFPRLKFTRLHDYLHQLETTLDCGALPTWHGDLYLELHRGCYTTHGDQKRYNRQLESLLYRAELWASLATIVLEQVFSPQTHRELQEAWTLVLLNQFHDILPGSSIPEVFTQATADWEMAKTLAEKVLQRSLQQLSQAIQPLPFPGKSGSGSEEKWDKAFPLIIFNSVPQRLNAPQRSQLIRIDPATLDPAQIQDVEDESTDLTHWQAWTDQGEALALERSEEGHLLIWVNDIPGVGYALIWLTVSSVTPLTPLTLSEVNALNLAKVECSFTRNELTDQLENEYLTVTIDRLTGLIQQIYSKSLDRNILNGAGNQLQTFHDRGQYWDAWNIDPHYEEHPYTAPQCQSCECLESNALRQRIRVTYQLNQSRLQQDYILEIGCPWLTIKTIVDWQEDQVLLKAAFLLAFENDRLPQFTTEMASGAIVRPIQSSPSSSSSPASAPSLTPASLTPAESAQWEVPIHRWFDVSNDRWGVSLLNDSKYGADVKHSGDTKDPYQLRLSLLRSPCWPDPKSDRGHHEFSYGIYPHCDRLNPAQIAYAAQCFNQPLDYVSLEQSLEESNQRQSNQQQQPEPPQPWPARMTLLNLGSDSLALMAFKPTESGDGYVLRCYESAGKSTQLHLALPFPITNLQPVDGLEMPLDKPLTAAEVVAVNPWQIKSWFLGRLTN